MLRIYSDTQELLILGAFSAEALLMLLAVSSVDNILHCHVVIFQVEIVYIDSLL